MINANKFWANTTQEGECLVWTGATNQTPLYGIFSAPGGRLIAHRVAYGLAYGELPDHAHVGRTCNNPLCVAPQHLYLQNSHKSQNPVLDERKKIASQMDKTEDGCWVWKGKRPKCLAVSSGLKTVPRAVYEVHFGEIPKGKEVVPQCSTPTCLNPEHLKLVDRAILGKSNSKLTYDEVQEIRKLAHTGEYGLIELAEKFKTSRQTIYTVVYNLGWHDPAYVPPLKMPRRPRSCRKGHSLDGDNVVTVGTTRKCKICLAAASAARKPKKSAQDRFWEKVDKSGNCWLWTAYSHNGWGYFSMNRTPQLAHRVAYEFAHGPIPYGMRVKNTCGNDLCVNPDHLYIEERMAAK